MGVRRRFLHTPSRVGLALTRLVGLPMRDASQAHDQVFGLLDGLSTSGEPPTGTTRVGDWLEESGDGLGRRYVSELRRNYRGRGHRDGAARGWLRGMGGIVAAHPVLS